MAFKVDNPFTIDQEEECSSFVCDCTSNQSFPSSRWSVQQDATGRLSHRINHLIKSFKSDIDILSKCLISYFYTDGLEECWVPEWQLHHFFNLSQLLPNTSDVIIADFIQGFFFILSTQNALYLMLLDFFKLPSTQQCKNTLNML